MARGRMVIRTIAIDKDLNQISEFGQLLYLRMIPFQDDEGCLTGNIYELKLEVFPASLRDLKDFELALEEMDKNGLIEWTKNICIEMRGFGNSNPIGHRPQKSTFKTLRDKYLQEKVEKGRERSEKVEKGSTLPNLFRPLVPNIINEFNEFNELNNIIVGSQTEPTGETKNPPKGKKPKPQKPTDPRVKELIGSWCVVYKHFHNDHPYRVVRGRDGKLLKDMLRFTDRHSMIGTDRSVLFLTACFHLFWETEQAKEEKYRKRKPTIPTFFDSFDGLIENEIDWDELNSEDGWIEAERELAYVWKKEDEDTGKV